MRIHWLADDSILFVVHLRVVQGVYLQTIDHQ